MMLKDRVQILLRQIPGHQSWSALGHAFMRDQTAATAIEYAFIASLIAGVLFVTVGVLGQKLDNLYKNAGNF